MKILNIAGYKFVSLVDLPELRATLLAHCERLALKGTILLSSEGINISLAGQIDAIEELKSSCFQQDARFSDITFRESYSSFYPFKRLKVRIKNEIITMRHAEIQPEKQAAPHISPHELKQWLDENRDITLLDTRNDYEIEMGTFKGALDLGLNDFCEFPEAAEQQVDRNKPVVMFCTGGIRCEKAAIYMRNAGFSEVYQLQGGILNYFAEVGGEHYEGECFVFDQRISVDATLQEKNKEPLWD